jgi:hypothetical protein
MNRVGGNTGLRLKPCIKFTIIWREDRKLGFETIAVRRINLVTDAINRASKYHAGDANRNQQRS